VAPFRAVAYPSTLRLPIRRFVWDLGHKEVSTPPYPALGSTLHSPRPALPTHFRAPPFSPSPPRIMDDPCPRSLVNVRAQTVATNEIPIPISPFIKGLAWLKHPKIGMLEHLQQAPSVELISNL
jgi:hypothetical protein